MAIKTFIGTDGSYSTNANWSPTNIPAGGDYVYIPAGAGSITTGLNQSAVTDLAGFVVADGYTGTIGSGAGYLQIDILNSTGVFDFNGQGVAYIDIGNSAISPTVRQTGGATALGGHGLYLKGSGIVTLNVIGGDVAVGGIYGETATVTTIRSVGDKAEVFVGDAVTLTTFYQTAGDSLLTCAATTVTIWGGTLRTTGVGAITTMNVYSGDVFPGSTGTITTLNANGGSTSFIESGASRTVTTLAQNHSSSVTYDPNVLAVTNRSAPSGPVRIDLTLAA